MESVALMQLREYIAGKLGDIERRMKVQSLNIPRLALIAWTPGAPENSIVVTDVRKGEERELLDTLAQRIGLSTTQSAAPVSGPADPTFKASDFPADSQLLRQQVPDETV